MKRKSDKELFCLQYQTRLLYKNSSYRPPCTGKETRDQEKKNEAPDLANDEEVVIPKALKQLRLNIVAPVFVNGGETSTPTKLDEDGDDDVGKRDGDRFLRIHNLLN